MISKELLSVVLNRKVLEDVENPLRNKLMKVYVEHKEYDKYYEDINLYEFVNKALCYFMENDYDFNFISNGNDTLIEILKHDIIIHQFTHSRFRTIEYMIEAFTWILNNR